MSTTLDTVILKKGESEWRRRKGRPDCTQRKVWPSASVESRARRGRSVQEAACMQHVQSLVDRLLSCILLPSFLGEKSCLVSSCMVKSGASRARTNRRRRRRGAGPSSIDASAPRPTRRALMASHALLWETWQTRRRLRMRSEAVLFSLARPSLGRKLCCVGHYRAIRCVDSGLVLCC